MGERADETERRTEAETTSDGDGARPSCRRLAARVPADGVSIAVEVAGGLAVGRIYDVSRSGLRIALDDLPSLGARLRLIHASAGEFSGTCVRQGAGEIGVAFDASTREVERVLQCLALLLADEAGDA